ncbi:response regulator [Saccharibacillus endophyticus]|uniref:DNA-binding response regulator n=1 Tax=Saccharibacillus endophyticus TaxID=2060666 RepID=A0ABQ1ZK73_9BACL|nr:response regulator transcription factor [Saccharibacillus endophyticus]GGH69611.1 DNA-binding response regulator [Saccharibacillus endophyticus]
MSQAEENRIYAVLIADDHLVVREGLKLILETNPRFRIAGEAENGEIAVKLAEKAKPDAILMDLNMPIMGGLEAMKAMNRKGLDIPVIILTTYNEDDMIADGLELGAKGYLLKDTGREHLFRTIESAVRGETLLQADIVSRAFAARQKRQSTEPAIKAESVLSPKEVQTLQLVAKGYRSKEIAFDMGISERTVKAHLTNIYNKLGVDSRMQAISAAVEQGIVHL